MTKLPNGLYRIKNTKTGQTKDVPATDLGKYGLKPQGGNDLIPQVVGGIGGTIGQALGTPFDALTGPAGTMAGGALLGGASQGTAEAVRELLPGGGGLNLGNIAGETGQGAAFGAIPGVEEARTGELGGEVAAKTGVLNNVLKLLKPKAPITAKGLAKRGVMRAGLGAAGGGTAQAIQNLQQGNPVGQNVPQAAAGTGAANAVLPGALQEGGNFLKNVGRDIWQRTVGGPIDEMQRMFNTTASTAVGDYHKQYAINKGIIPSEKNPTTGQLEPHGLMTNDYIDNAVAKAKSVGSTVEAKLQALLPSQKERPVKQDEIQSMLNDFFQRNYAGEPQQAMGGKVASPMDRFISDLKQFSKKTGTSDAISTQDVINFLKGGEKTKPAPGTVAKLVPGGEGSVALINTLKRIAGRGFNVKAPGAWNGLYHDLRDFVEQNSKDPQKVSDLNKEHFHLMKIKQNLNNFKSGQFPINSDEATHAMEHARFGQTIGFSGERALPESLLGAQMLGELGGGAAGYQAAGGLGLGLGLGATAVAPYILAGTAKAGIGHFSMNPNTSEKLARLIQSKGATANAVKNLLQQQIIRQPNLQNQ